MEVEPTITRKAERDISAYSVDQEALDTTSVFASKDGLDNAFTKEGSPLSTVPTYSFSTLLPLALPPLKSE